jgi:hypothetical protein
MDLFIVHLWDERVGDKADGIPAAGEEGNPFYDWRPFTNRIRTGLNDGLLPQNFKFARFSDGGKPDSNPRSQLRKIEIGLTRSSSMRPIPGNCSSWYSWPML